MTGDKPDERLRTPMQWTAGASGFTSGRPWEALQADTLTTNVARESADSGSLLNVYRRLIHLRAANAALGSGELVPLTASSDAVLAYLRREGSRRVLVVANLGTTALTSVTLATPAGTLPAGRYTARALYGGPSGAALTVNADGSMTGYGPLPTVAPMRTYIFELSRRRP
jgi:glycosidase